MGHAFIEMGFTDFKGTNGIPEKQRPGGSAYFLLFYHNDTCRMVRFLIVIFHADGLCWLCWNELRLNTTIFALLMPASHVATLVHSGDGSSVQWGSTSQVQPSFVGGSFPGC